MSRRHFLRHASAAAGAALVLDPARLTAKDAAPRRRNGLLSAYYLRAHTNTLVPHQVREDLQWLADVGENGERFLAAAKQQNKKSVWLIENHNLKAADIPLLDKRLPEVLAAGADQLIYYYYPRNLQSPDRIMACFKRHLLAASGLRPK